MAFKKDLQNTVNQWSSNRFKEAQTTGSTSDLPWSQNPHLGFSVGNGDFKAANYPLKGWMVSLALPPAVMIFFLNPERITDRKSVGWQNKDRYGQYEPQVRWSKGGARTLNFDLYLDSRLMNIDPAGIFKGVEIELAKFQSLMYPKPSYDFSSWQAGVQSVIGFSDRQGTRFQAPPRVIFGFGSEILECVVIDMPIEKLAFDHMLRCTRARVNLTLQVIGDSYINAANDVKRRIYMTYGLANSYSAITEVMKMLSGVMGIFGA